MLLEPGAVATAAIEGLAGLNFSGAAVWALEDDGTLVSGATLGFASLLEPPNPEGVVPASGFPAVAEGGVARAVKDISDLVLSSGTTVVARADEPARAEIARRAGFHTVVAAPVRVGGRDTAILIAGHETAPTTAEAQAFDFLAALAGAALYNAERLDQLRQTLTRLEQMARLKSDFLATISHDVRTPLAVVLGNSQTLQRLWDELRADERVRLLSSLDANSRALESVIISALEVAQMDETSGPHAAELDLSALAVACAERLRPLFLNRRLETIVEPEVVVHANGRLLQRVFDNLIANAAKHTSEGSHSLLVLRREAGRAIVIVDDDGPGIPAHELPLLTQRHWRGGDPSDPLEGLGLGLSIVSDILRIHGAALEVGASTRGGARFAFRLPLEEDATATA
jgi:signal transduction histidine kinase